MKTPNMKTPPSELCMLGSASIPAGGIGAIPGFAGGALIGGVGGAALIDYHTITSGGA